MKQVICIFDRDLEDYDKSQLIMIYDNHDDALKHIEESYNEDLFWEVWTVSESYKGLFCNQDTLKEEGEAI